jgi:hypothetical protein
MTKILAVSGFVFLAALLRCSPSVPDNPPVDQFAARAYVAGDIVMTAPGGIAPEPGPKPVIEQCNICNNTGCVKSGDGISWVNCHNCGRDCTRQNRPTCPSECLCGTDCTCDPCDGGQTCQCPDNPQTKNTGNTVVDTIVTSPVPLPPEMRNSKFEEVAVEIHWDKCEGQYCPPPVAGDQGLVIGGPYDGRRVYMATDGHIRLVFEKEQKDAKPDS